MKKINWLYVGIGAVVLYLVWKKFGQGSNEQTANAIGKKRKRGAIAKAPTISKLRCNCDDLGYTGLGYQECYMGVNMRTCEECCNLANRVNRFR